ncbi:prophage lp4 protein 3, phage-like repressor [Levilactobacillus koreensis JCM 16448]|nr:prophage lp4 protein 3, phage-like repressor [Levilactobacillus koreensis JCM 16448]
MDAEAFTTADTIADYAGITHHSINVTVNKNVERLKRANRGELLFKMTPLISGQKAKTFLLNQQQATLLITFLKNTPRVADFKEELVRQFYAMQRELVERRARFELGKEFSKGLGTAVAESQIDQHGHEFSNFNRLVYRQALGVDSTKLRKVRSIPRDEPITHYLTSEEAEAVRLVKQRVITFLGAGMDYQQIKNVLNIKGVILQVTLKLPTTAK